MGSLSAELAQSEQLFNQLTKESKQHASLADKVQSLYIDNAQAGSYMVRAHIHADSVHPVDRVDPQQPFDADLEGYSIRDNESHESYCNRLLKVASELREQANKEAKQASEVQEADIPQIVCDFQW